MVLRLDDPIIALVDDLLKQHASVYKPKLIAQRVQAEYVRRGGDTGDSAAQRIFLTGLVKIVRDKVKRIGYYDRSTHEYRAYVGSNERQLRGGGDYKIRKGGESVEAGRGLHRLADLLHDAGLKTVSSDLLLTWRQTTAPSED